MKKMLFFWLVIILCSGQEFSPTLSSLAPSVSFTTAGSRFSINLIAKDANGLDLLDSATLPVDVFMQRTTNDTVPWSVVENRASFITFSFHSLSISGLYRLFVRDTFYGVNVASSPLTVSVLPAAPKYPLVAQCSVPAAPMAGKVQISFAPLDAFGNPNSNSVVPLQARIILTSTVDSTFYFLANSSVMLLATRAGSFPISISLANATVLGSPDFLKVIPATVSVTDCRIIRGESQVITAGATASFLVQTFDMFGNIRTDSPGVELDAFVRGPDNNIPMNIVDHGTGLISISTQVTVSGQYSVLVSSVSVLINRGIFINFTVLPDGFSPQHSTVELLIGSILDFSGSLRRLAPIPRDMWSNPTALNSSTSFFFELLSSDGGLESTKYISSGDVLDWFLPKSGTWSVFVSYGTFFLSNSPLTLVSVPGFPSSGESDVISSGGVVGQTAMFYIRSKDSYGNARSSPYDFASCLGTYSGDAESGSIGTWNFDPISGLYSNSLLVNTAGDYSVSLDFPRGDVRQFTLSVISEIGDPLPLNSILSGSGTKQFSVGVEASVLVQLRNFYGFNIVSASSNGTWGRTYGIFLSDSGDAQALVGTDKRDGTYTVKIARVTRAGNYRLSVWFRDVFLTGRAPLLVIVTPGPCSKLNTICNGPGLTGPVIPGNLTSIIISPFDSFGNPLGYSASLSKLFAVKATQGPVISVSGDMSYSSTSAKYRATYTLTISGKYSINVILNGTDHVSGSPFSLTVASLDTTIASTTSAVGQGLSSAVAGSTATFSIQTRDIYGNPTTDTTFPFSALVSGPSNFSIAVSSSGSMTYLVTQAGQYFIDVFFKSSPISGSPFKVQVSAAGTSITNTLVDVSAINSAATLQTFRPFDIWIFTRDAYGNNRTSGGDVFVLDMGSTHLTFQDLGTGSYWIQTSSSLASSVTLSVSFRGIALVSKNVTFSTGRVSRAKSLILFDHQVTVGSASTVTLTTRDDSFSVWSSPTSETYFLLLASSISPVITSVFTREGTSAKYNCFFLASVPGRYTGAVFIGSINSDNIIGKPFELNVVSATISSRPPSTQIASTPTGEAHIPNFVADTGTYIAGSVLTIRITPRDISGNVISTEPQNITLRAWLGVSQFQPVWASGVYTISAYLTKSGKYQMGIWSGVDANVPSGPTLNFNFVVLPLEAISVSVSIVSPPMFAFVATSNQISVIARDKFSNSLSVGGLVFSAILQKVDLTGDDFNSNFIQIDDIRDYNNGTYGVIFSQVSLPGNYSVSVLLSGLQPVGASPVKFHVSPGAPSPPRCVVDFRQKNLTNSFNLTVATAGRPFQFSVTLVDVFGNLRSAPDDETTRLSVGPDGLGAYTISSFRSISAPGLFLGNISIFTASNFSSVFLRVGGSAVGSPITLTVLPSSVSAEMSEFHTENCGAECAVGAKIRLDVLPRDLYANTISVELAPMERPVSRLVNSDSNAILAQTGCKFMFELMQPHRYTCFLELRTSGNISVAALILGSPVGGASAQFMVKSGSGQAVDLALFSPISSPVGTAGSPFNVTLRSTDTFGNQVFSGGAVVSFGMMSAASDSRLIDSTYDFHDGTYAITIFSASSKNYTVFSQSLFGSRFPLFLVTVLPGPINASRTIGRGSGLRACKLFRISYFNIQQRDAFGNINRTKTSGFSVTATPVPFNPPTLGAFDPINGEWSVSYKVQDDLLSFMQISVNFSGAPIFGSPFVDIKVLKIIGPAVVAACTFFGGGVRQQESSGDVSIGVIAGDPSPAFSIQTANSDGFSLAGEPLDPSPQDFRFLFEGPTSVTGNVAAGAPATGTFIVTVPFTISGSYLFQIILAKAQSSVFTISVSPGEAMALTSSLPTNIFSLIAGIKTNVEIILRDEFGNTGATLSQSSISANTSDSLLAVTFVKSVVGSQQLFATLYCDWVSTFFFQIAINNVAISSNQTFSLSVSPNVASSKTTTFAMPKTAVAGVPFSVVVTPRDAFGNPIINKRDEVFRVLFWSAVSSTMFPAYPCPATNSSCSGIYSTEKVSLTSSGTYSVLAQRKNIDVWEDASEFGIQNIQILASDLNAGSFIVTEVPKSTRLGQAFDICVKAFDHFGNPWPWANSAARIGATIGISRISGSVAFAPAGEKACVSLSPSEIGVSLVFLRLDNTFDLVDSPYLVTVQPAVAPKILSANLSSSLTSIVITFDVPTNKANLPTTFSCSLFFDIDSVAKLGGTPSICIWRNSSLLEIMLGSSPTIMPTSVSNDALVPSGSLRLMNFQENSDLFRSPILIAAPSFSPKPVASLFGASLLCPCCGLELDASDSTGGAGRSLRFAWSLQFGSSDDLVNFLKTQTGPRISLSPDLTSRLFNLRTAYVILVTVTNAFGQTATANKTMTRVPSNPLPTVFIRSAQPLSEISLGRPTRFEGVINVSSCAGSSVSNSALDITWSISTSTNRTQTTLSKLRDLVLPISGFTLSVGKMYTVQLSVSVLGFPTLLASDSVNVTVVPQKLSAVILGGNFRTVSTTDSFKVDGGSSVDPDGPSTDSWIYRWSCENMTAGTDPGARRCISPLLTTQLFSSVPALTFSPTPIGTYRFNLTVSRGLALRSSSTSVVIHVVSSAVPQYYVTSSGNLAKFNPSDRLLLSSSLVGLPTKIATTNNSWSVLQGDVIPDTFVVLSPRSSSFFYVEAGSLVAGSKYVFQFSSQYANTINKGAVNVEVTTNSPPVGGRCYSEPSATVPLSPILLICNPAFVDDVSDYPLQYEWALVGGFEWSTSNPPASVLDWQTFLAKYSSVSYTPLAPRGISSSLYGVRLGAPVEIRSNGRVLIRVCCFDSYDASSCRFVTILVSGGGNLDLSSVSSILTQLQLIGDAASVLRTVSAVAKSTITLSRRRSTRALSPDMLSLLVNSLQSTLTMVQIDDVFSSQFLLTAGQLALTSASSSTSASPQSIDAAHQLLQLSKTVLAGTNSSDQSLAQGVLTVMASALTQFNSASSAGIISSASARNIADLATDMSLKLTQNLETTLVSGFKTAAISASADLQFYVAKVVTNLPIPSTFFRTSAAQVQFPGNGSIPVSNFTFASYFFNSTSNKTTTNFTSRAYIPEALTLTLTQYDRLANPYWVLTRFASLAVSPLLNVSFATSGNGSYPVSFFPDPMTVSFSLSSPLSASSSTPVLTCNRWNISQKMFTRRGCISLAENSSATVNCSCFSLGEFMVAAEPPLIPLSPLAAVNSPNVFTQPKQKQIAVLISIVMLVAIFSLWGILAFRKDNEDFCEFRADPEQFLTSRETSQSPSLFFRFGSYWWRELSLLEKYHPILGMWYSMPYCALSRFQIVVLFFVFLTNVVLVNSVFFAYRSENAAASAGVWSAYISLLPVTIFNRIFRAIKRRSLEISRNEIAEVGDATDFSRMSEGSGYLNKKGSAWRSLKRSASSRRVARVSPAPPRSPPENSDRSPVGDPFFKAVTTAVAVRSTAAIWGAGTIHKGQRVAASLQRLASSERLNRTQLISEIAEDDKWGDLLPSRRFFYLAHLLVAYYCSIAMYLIVYHAIHFTEGIATQWIGSVLWAIVQYLILMDVLYIFAKFIILISFQRLYWFRKQKKIDEDRRARSAQIAPDVVRERGVGPKQDSPKSFEGLSKSEKEKVLCDLAADTDFYYARQTNNLYKGTYHHELLSPPLHYALLDLSHKPNQKNGNNIQPGILRHIGSSLGTTDYTSEYWDKLFQCSVPSSASHLREALFSFSDELPAHPVVLSGRKSQPPWVTVDVGAGLFYVVPKQYSLRHGRSTYESVLTDWDLQGSLDGEVWTTLRSHREEPIMEAGNIMQTWLLDSSPSPVRFLRIRMTAVNSHKKFDLCLSGFEIYGHLVCVSGEHPEQLILPPPEDAPKEEDLPSRITVSLHRCEPKPENIGILRGGLSHLDEDLEEVALTHSGPSLSVGTLLSLCSSERGVCVTQPLEKSWIQIDFGPGKGFLPKCYVLRHGFDHASKFLRNWELQGSNDLKFWHTLDERISDQSMSQTFAEANFDVISRNRRLCRYLRILQTGPNSSGDHSLCLGGVEFFGVYGISKEVFKVEKVEEFVPLPDQNRDLPENWKKWKSKKLAALDKHSIRYHKKDVRSAATIQYKDLNPPHENWQADSPSPKSIQILSLTL